MASAGKWRRLERRLSKIDWTTSNRTSLPWPLVKQRPAIVTSYSFKGGVGRTTLLASVAWQLASKGKRVVAIDLDVEALHASRNEGQRVLRSPGLDQSPHTGHICDLGVTLDANRLRIHGLQLSIVLAERSVVLPLDLDQLRRDALDTRLRFVSSLTLLFEGVADGTVFILELEPLGQVGTVLVQ